MNCIRDEDRRDAARLPSNNPIASQLQDLGDGKQHIPDIGPVNVSRDPGY